MPAMLSTRARSSRVRGAAILALGVCALWSFQSQHAFSEPVVQESSGMAKTIADHALFVSLALMIACGAFAYTEQAQPAAAGPAEKRPDYSSFVMISNILCFTSGFVNALAIIDMGMTVSHQTGNTSHTGRLIMNGGIKFFHLMLAFATGSFVAGFSKCDQEAIYQGRYSPNLLAAAFAVMFGCLVHYCKAQAGIANDDASECLFLWAFSQGIQNGITRRCSSLPVCTTHFTGYLTDFGVGLGLWARAQADGAEPPTLLKVFLFGSGIFFFGLGGVAAMETHPAWGAQAALIPAAIMAAVAGGLVPVVKAGKAA
eukprot:CAMPEP_0181422972 /NCGR_PEP_ID=MMETSP1110-20121109/13889_1 /TAXON_ID=174948 /ORGANISM="Symbiodinium sp., Strain CCMP421" /LENGTH=313 /DNA_ID=CAMNT_0023546085 /DNA_START=41 /DNA_END=982 /DNA_ORIENTATION=+